MDVLLAKLCSCWLDRLPFLSASANNDCAKHSVDRRVSTSSNLISHVDGIINKFSHSILYLPINPFYISYAIDVKCYYVVSFKTFVIYYIFYNQNTCIRHYGRVVKATDLNWISDHIICFGFRAQVQTLLVSFFVKLTAELFYNFNKILQLNSER